MMLTIQFQKSKYFRVTDECMQYKIDWSKLKRQPFKNENKEKQTSTQICSTLQRRKILKLENYRETVGDELYFISLLSENEINFRSSISFVFSFNVTYNPVFILNVYIQQNIFHMICYIVTCVG